MLGRYADPRHGRPDDLPYPTMTLDAIKALPVQQFTEVDCHLWLWTTNAFLRQGFEVLDAWGFKYLAPVHWIKPSGFGNYFLHRTQTVLFGYRGKCVFKTRFKPNIINAPSRRHSQKPECSYELIEQVSYDPYLELFARHKRPGWSVWGNEVASDIEMR
jgi:N6-adenosine-specific RNA methylase IME4